MQNTNVVSIVALQNNHKKWLWNQKPQAKQVV